MRTVAQKAARLQQLLPLLICPLCQGHLTHHDRELVCEACHTHYPILKGVPILLSPEMRAQGLGRELGADEQVSMHPYSPASEALIAEHPQGWVLDLGAGGKHIEHNNVVQVDVFCFPMVDVVASADALPFKANAFDAVISQAVFEHLQYPEVAASEIWRILKANGIAKIDTAFLQPEHAYPHHYFNATEAGLKHWFRDFDVQWSGVEFYQHPKWALVWFLSVYFAGLHDKDRLLVETLTLSECVAMLSRASKGESTHADQTYLQAMDGLVPETVRKLAAGVSVKAIKQAGVPGIHRRGHTHHNAHAELEHRLKVQAQHIQDHQNYKKTRAEIDLISSDSTRFLLHEYELNRQDLLLAPGVVFPIMYVVMRELRQRVPLSWWEKGRAMYREWTKPPPTPPMDTLVIPKTALAFWNTPTTPPTLLNQFFSLTRQTHGDWVYFLQQDASHSSTMKRLMWELAQRDARVHVLSAEVIRSHLSSIPSIALSPETVLAFDAVLEFVTLLQHSPDVQHVTADIEQWNETRQEPMRCWGQHAFDEQDKGLDLHPENNMQVLLNKRPSASSPLHQHLKKQAHIPKVLYRLIPFAIS